MGDLAEIVASGPGDPGVVDKIQNCLQRWHVDKSEASFEYHRADRTRRPGGRFVIPCVESLANRRRDVSGLVRVSNPDDDPLDQACLAVFRLEYRHVTPGVAGPYVTKAIYVFSDVRWPSFRSIHQEGNNLLRGFRLLRLNLA